MGHMALFTISLAILQMFSDKIKGSSLAHTLQKDGKAQIKQKT